MMAVNIHVGCYRMLWLIDGLHIIMLRTRFFFFYSTRDQTREREDPSQYPAGPHPQDETDYIREPEQGMFSPGMGVSTGPAADSRPTISGILLRKGDTQYITVANHAFSDTQVFHPAPHGDKIGDIIKRYPELDIAMVQLTPANSHRFTNNTYFQTEPPKHLAQSSDITPGTWFEVDGMSTGLLSFPCLGKALEKPACPITDIPAAGFFAFGEWCLGRVCCAR